MIVARSLCRNIQLNYLSTDTEGIIAKLNKKNLQIFLVKVNLNLSIYLDLLMMRQRIVKEVNKIFTIVIIWACHGVLIFNQ